MWQPKRRAEEQAFNYPTSLSTNLACSIKLASVFWEKQFKRERLTAENWCDERSAYISSPLPILFKTLFPAAVFYPYCSGLTVVEKTALELNSRWG